MNPPTARIPKHFSVVLLLLFSTALSIPRARALQSGDFTRNTKSSSILANTQWKLQLDVGLQPGTWMPKRYPGWAESGARLGLGVQVQFSKTPSPTAEPLLGPLTDTYQLQVTSPPSTFVSAKGQESVEFTTGGWCISRPTANVKNARQDVEVFPGTRIFFTTGVWDDPRAVELQEQEYHTSLDQLNQLMTKTQENKEKTKQQNILEQLDTFTEMVGDSRKYDALKDKCKQLGQELPPLGSPKASNGCLLAPNGSLVIKGKNNAPDWMPTSEYLILGTFSTAAVDG